MFKMVIWSSLSFIYIYILLNNKEILYFILKYDPKVSEHAMLSLTPTGSHYFIIDTLKDILVILI